jgi:TonB family protein
MSSFARLAAATVAALILAPAAVAAAGAPRFASGGPRAKAARDSALAAVRVAHNEMAPCWRGTPPAEVMVALTVGPAGEVVQSAPRSVGPAAQCAAGLLAVAVMPASGQRWTAVVGVPSVSAPPAADLQAEISRQLGEHRAALAACQSVDPNAAGELALTLAISETGIIAPTVARSSVSKAIEACVAGTLRRTALALPEKRAARYRLDLSFAGEGAGRAAPARPTGAGEAVGAAPALKAGSALAADQIERVVGAQKAELTRCGRTASGDVVVGFTVRPDGTTKNVAVKSSTVGDPAVEACLVKRVEGLRFPAAGGESRVTWPFQYRRPS